MNDDLRKLVEKWRLYAKTPSLWPAMSAHDFYELTGGMLGCADELQDALDAQAGMVLVPRVPTGAMLTAGADAGQWYPPVNEQSECALVYAAMLAAAGPVEGGDNG